MSLTYRSALTLAVVAGSLSVPLIRADTPTTMPVAAARSVPEIQEDLARVNQKLGPVLANSKSFADASQRPAAAAVALPLLKEMDRLFDEVAVAQPAAVQQMKAAHVQIVEFKSALGDADAAQQLATIAADPDVGKALRGQVSQMKVQWLQAGTDAAAQAKVVDSAGTLAKAHPESSALTGALGGCSQNAATPELADRILTMALGMSNPAVQQVQQMKTMADASNKLRAMENKPFVLKGTTVDGKAFSTEDFKGKVILVDFWATWCGPCKAELPKVQAAYAKYHDQGMEIVGVSNDYSAGSLRSFTQQQNMPWPELYNNDAGSNREWNPTTIGYGISGIPHMFVIDRNGVLVSADARAKYETLISELMQQHG